MDDVLGGSPEHVDGYWSVAKAHVTGFDAAPAPLADFVNVIRRKVNRALEESDGDTEAVLVSIRSMYREFKTVGVNDCVDRVMEASSSSTS